ncbi:hypothetical protein, partial [Brevundimonas vesicularis]|uniref:hypothetical protein n=1 Tax=Brevundimonas vesicularis TaxID=41276 RepID=UPI001C3F663A
KTFGADRFFQVGFELRSRRKTERRFRKEAAFFFAPSHLLRDVSTQRKGRRLATPPSSILILTPINR